MHLEDKTKKSARRRKWSHVATFPECRVSVVRGGDATGNMEHAIDAIHCKRRDEKSHLFSIKKAKYLSVRLCSHGRAFARFFHRGFLFSSGFGDVSSHASGATKEHDRSNDWTKTASFLSKFSSQAQRLPHQPKPRTEPKTEQTAKKRAGTHKMWQRCRRKEISSKKLSPSWADFGNGEIGPAANEMRSTTPKSADEWAPGLWRQSHGGSTNHKSRPQRAGRKRRRGRSWSWRREGVMDNGRHNNNKTQLLLGFPFI